MTTGIEWTDETWNFLRGCSHKSEGCRFCYAEPAAARVNRQFAAQGRKEPYEGLVKLVPRQRGDRTVMEAKWTRVVRFVPERLAEPLKWRAPKNIFVNSMSDLFHEDVSNEVIAAAFGVMAACPQHTFQILTKRTKRSREWFAWLERGDFSEDLTVAEGIAGYLDDTACGTLAGHFDCCHLGLTTNAKFMWPLPNVWLGTSVENQDAADERIPDLLLTPAAVRFLSCEPLLGPIDLDAVQIPGERSGLRFGALRHLDSRYAEAPALIDWVIAGCESGPNARPCASSWLRSLRNQCAEASVPYFLKQAHPGVWVSGQRAPGHAKDDGRNVITTGPGSKRKPGGIIGLPYLDGVQHSAMPPKASP